ncbi:uncharacterized protein LOC122364147, partial [Amphibalanus amphitrite]|uniref:uncharacterized protein LOC122364147 n=1 Tax=Amphibalanus amphitrite TaxID=1232801 RepID=UPI001C92AB05
MGEIDGEESAAVDVVPQAEDPRPPTAELLRVGRRLQRRSVSQSSTDSTCHPAHPGADQAANDSAGSGKAGDLSTSASGRLSTPAGGTRPVDPRLVDPGWCTPPGGPRLVVARRVPYPPSTPVDPCQA